MVVRYFLDRPGYDLHNSAARFWFNPPSTVTPVDVLEYLTKQGIALPGLLVEVYLDRFGSYMLLEACQHNLVEWDFSETSNNIPGILNIRLTDMLNAEQEEVKSEVDLRFPSAQQETKKSIEIANITPSGLFSFSMMVGLETVALMSKMFPELIAESWVISWGPYMFFVGGVMQIIVAVVQTFRNNLYGATAFLGFGTFWFSNGLTAILATHFSGDGTLAQELIDDSDPGGLFFRSLFSFAFTAVLLKQTFVMSKLSTTLISLLCLKIAAGAFTGWFEEFRWLQLIFGVATSGFAFWVFTVELTNQIYHREVFPTYKWSQKHSPEEVLEHQDGMEPYIPRLLGCDAQVIRPSKRYEGHTCRLWRKYSQVNPRMLHRSKIEVQAQP